MLSLSTGLRAPVYSACNIMLECVQWSTALVYQYLFANFSTMNMLHIYEFYSQLFDGGVGGEGGGGFPAGPIIGQSRILDPLTNINNNLC